jgi:transposase InsO family protein
MHANREAGRAESAAHTGREWERIARATQAHRAETTASLALLVHRYNTLARKATAEQRRLLAKLATARRRAAHSKPAGAAPVTYETTQSVAVAAPISAPAAPVASATPVATSDPVTKTS